MKNKNWFRKTSLKEYNSGLVSPSILPKYEKHGFNLETKATKLFFDMYTLHMRLFGSGKNMPVIYFNKEEGLVEDCIDISTHLNNPKDGYKVKDWNKHIELIISLQDEFKQLMRLIYKTIYQVKNIDSTSTYDTDKNAHSSNQGRWKFYHGNKRNAKSRFNRG
tara:strand:+ start:93 stop:581 length:489 start_codon:yes stop_codon:yes gene_type:complete